MCPKAERLKRPTLTLIGQSINFHYKFVQYKERLSDNKDNPARLLECLTVDVPKMLYSSIGAEIKNLTEQGSKLMESKFLDLREVSSEQYATYIKKWHLFV